MLQVRMEELAQVLADIGYELDCGSDVHPNAEWRDRLDSLATEMRDEAHRKARASLRLVRGRGGWEEYDPPPPPPSRKNKRDSSENSFPFSERRKSWAPNDLRAFCG